MDMDYSKKLDYLQKDCEKFKDTESVYRKAVEEGDASTIFKCYHRLCSALVFQKLKKTKLSNQEKQDKALGATLYAMEKAKKKGMKYDTLMAWCSFSVIEFLYNKQAQFEDAVTYDDELIQNRGEE